MLDASAAIRTAAGEAKAELTRSVADAELVLVPSLFDYEVTNVVWKYVQAGVWDETQAERVLELALGLPDRRVDGDSLSREVLVEASSAKRAAYDLFYVVLARRTAAVLLTADAKLRRFAKSLGVRTA